MLLDLDGTLAPIVARPEDTEPSPGIPELLERIKAGYGLTAIVTGRPPLVARDIVGIDGLLYAGNHGLELLEAGAVAPVPAPELGERASDVAAFAAETVDRDSLERAGIRFEDKGPILALHWRGAPDEPAAEREAERIGAAARSAGLALHHGRKVLELRPSVQIDKGTAIEGLLARPGSEAIRTALFAGDDRTDLDGFAALGRALELGRLDAVARVGVGSPEGPVEVVEAADIVVEGAERMPELLEVLAG